jgi:hypothetical protein
MATRRQSPWRAQRSRTSAASDWGKRVVGHGLGREERAIGGVARLCLQCGCLCEEPLCHNAVGAVSYASKSQSGVTNVQTSRTIWAGETPPGILQEANSRWRQCLLGSLRRLESGVRMPDLCRPDEPSLFPAPRPSPAEGPDERIRALTRIDGPQQLDRRGGLNRTGVPVRPYPRGRHHLGSVVLLDLRVLAWAGREQMMTQTFRPRRQSRNGSSRRIRLWRRGCAGSESRSTDA